MVSQQATIRRARATDATVLASLILAFRNHLAASTPTDADLERYLPRALEDPGLEFYCAWLDGEPVGYTQIRFLASVWVSGVEAHLEDLFVIVPARGRAVGRALLRHAVTRARERGARRFSLTTNEANQTARALYRSEGLSPQSHALYPGGSEVLWVKSLLGA